MQVHLNFARLGHGQADVPRNKQCLTARSNFFTIFVIAVAIMPAIYIFAICAAFFYTNRQMWQLQQQQKAQQ